MTTKPYVRPMPKLWWLQRPAWRAYMLREISSLAMILYAAVLLHGIYRLSQGPEAWEAWLTALHHPLSIAAHIVILIFALIHTSSWFKLAPQAMPIQIGTERVPDKVILLANYAAFVIVSVIVFFLAARA